MNNEDSNLTGNIKAADMLYLEFIPKCPFCGDNGRLWRRTDLNKFYICCDRCGASTKDYIQGFEALDAWRQRFRG